MGKIINVKDIIRLITFILLLFFSSSSVNAALDPLHAPSLLNFKERFDTDLYTGSANYSYDIKIPDGTNKLTPVISISYNSSGSKDPNTRTGMGWILSQDYIERDVNFTPSNTSDDKFRLYLQGAAYDLIYVSADSRYHTKIESNLNIQKLSNGQNDQGDYWLVITPNGTKYRFGYQAQSELVCNGRSYINAWNLDLVTDTNGNNIYYTYTESNGLSYVSQIKYNNDQQRIIDFTYASSSYQRNVYSQGCSTTDSSKLSNIKVKIGTNIIREYDFSYTTAGNTQPLLQSITEKGNDGSSLPATTFTYKPIIKHWSNTFVKWIDNAPVDVHLQKTDVIQADVTGDGLLDIVKSEGNGNNTWKVWRNTGSSWDTTAEIWVNNQPIDAKLDRSDTQLIDVTGDSLPDIVKANINGSDGSRSTWKIWRNTGSGWSTTTETWIDNAHLGTDLSRADTALFDANGDSLTDIVWTEQGVNNRSHWYVYKNTGNGWNLNRETWWDDVSIDARLDNPEVRVFDVNGDSLPEIVKVTHSGTNATWVIYKNTGSGWSTSGETWVNNANIDAWFGRLDVTIVDANGDGLVDVVKSTENPDKWLVMMNKGNSWAGEWEEWLNPNGTVPASLQGNTQMTDVTGDGLPDIIRTNSTNGYDTWEVFKNNGVSPFLLNEVTTALGGKISFEYTKSTSFDNTGADNISDLPFPMWLVQSMTVTNGLTNTQSTSDVTTYSYKDGYYDWQDREFRGFLEVNTTEPNGAKQKYVFNQSDALKGRLAELQVRDNQNNPYAETENSWSDTLNNGVYTVNLSQEKKYTYDGTSVNPKIIQSDYQYDSYGNVTKKSEQGDTNITGDERFTYFEYSTNTSSWIVNLLKRTYLHASDDSTKLSESWKYYDNNLQLTDTPIKGNVTKEVEWSNVSGQSNSTRTYQYDSYGNVTSETDANTHTTAYTYDGTGTYRATKTNALNHTTSFSYDLGTGNLLSETDPNGFTTSYSYDVFGRVIKEIKPYDNSSFPTVSYQYFTDGAAPDGVLVSKREVSSSSATLDSYTWNDGLGRVIQTRSEAESPSQQIVINTFYDPTGEVFKLTIPHVDSSSATYVNPLSNIGNTTTTYDVLGRPLIHTNFKGDNKTIAYDHWKETTIDENSNIKREYKNAYGKIVKVEEVNGSDLYTTTYEYDSRDLLKKITDHSNNAITYAYDSLERRTSHADFDMGTWEYEYDGVGNLTKLTDNRDVAIIKTYDAIDRLTKNDFPNDADVTFTYDGNNKKGTLTSVTDATGTTTYTYDNRLRKIQESQVMDNTTWTTQFTYDALDRLLSKTNPNNEVITYTFNTQGEVNSIDGILNDIDYNAQGKITEKEFGNGLTTQYTYNTNDFRLNRIQTGTLQNLSYTYDNVGNISTIANNVLNKTQTFTYDDLDRLTVASESAGFNYTYQYNPIGNLVSFTDSGNQINYTYGQNAGVHALTTSSETVNPPTISHTIYDEGLGTGWSDWSWSSTNNFNDTSTPNTGTKNISWAVTGGYGALYLHKTGGVDTTDYSDLTFSLKSTQAGQTVQVQLYDNTDTVIGNPVQLTIYGGDPVATNYKTYTIPLSALGGTNRTINGMIIQDTTGSSKPAMYVDTVKLTGTAPSPTPTPTPTPTATPTPTPTPPPNSTIEVYEEGLASGWSDWSWSSTNNFNDTSTPYSGSKNASWTATAGYAGLYLHKTGGVSTAGLDTLTFALRSTQSGQTVQIQLYDSSDTVIGSPVQLTNYGGTPISGSYKVYEIPLSTLGGSNTMINGILIQDTTGSSKPAMFIDSIKFKNSSSSPSAMIYTEGLASGWSDWSWSSTNNFNDTSTPRTGTKNLSWTATAGYAGLYIHHSGISTSSYNTLTFALKASQSGQTVQIQLYDSSGNTIGSPVQLTNYGGTPISGSYKVYEIPLSDLGGTNITTTGVLIQDTTGSSKPAMFVDDVGFIYK